jgi:hypothetical protein
VKKTAVAMNNQVIIDLNENNLTKELEFLKRRLNLGHELTLKWLPGEKDGICGEVKENVILIYEDNETKAIETLKHEFLDYLVSKAIEPYQKITNKLIGLINDEAYLRKAKLVEVLAVLIQDWEGVA